VRLEVEDNFGANLLDVKLSKTIRTRVQCYKRLRLPLLVRPECKHNDVGFFVAVIFHYFESLATLDPDKVAGIK
jgi:hypothetical protein